jgi:hypothetical protein
MHGSFVLMLQTAQSVLFVRHFKPRWNLTLIQAIFGLRHVSVTALVGPTGVVFMALQVLPKFHLN